MLARMHRPGPPLAGFVDLLWLYEGYIVPHATERLLPMGTMELVFDLAVDGVVFVGAHSQYFTLETARETSVIGVHFKPGGAFPFLGMPADELHNQHVALDALWGATSVRDRLLEAATPEEKFRILEEALIAHASRPIERDPAVVFALRELEDGQGRVSSILGTRRLVDRFTAEVGLTPKLYGRVQRFQHVLRLAKPGADWAGIAAECGYYDQAHLIHDFRAFSGMTPAMYAALATDHLNHVPERRTAS